MNRKPAFICTPVIVRDKTVTSHTTGSVTTSTQGRNVSVRNSIGTSVKLEALLEFPDGALLPAILIDESLHAPVGKKILMAFKSGEPVAYQVTPNGEVYALGYITEKETFTFQDFTMFTLPGVGTFFSLVSLAVTQTYYEHGEFKTYNGNKIVVAAGIAVTALGVYIAKGWFGYIVGTALTGIGFSISAIIGNSKANAGRKLMLGEIKNEFDKLKADL
ncbi:MULTISPECIES: hypothetical protein [Pseudomonas]|uniref:hypothetical protein n=1 Tax=Pseudomonas TaxID=286 RepID=UPI0014764BB8|nr:MULTISPECIES: hypothetical protein [Pseudomonas]MBO0493395.1 hypothetical protein [Pseudomonas sp. Marseille-Q1929]NMZ41195.1 hypothetical protein [Pseudomonas proteolytica]